MMEASNLFKAGKDYGKVIELLDVVIETAPSYFDAVSMRADAYVKSGSPEKASFDFRKASRLQPMNMKIMLKLAEVLFYEGSHEDGIAAVVKCFQMDEDMVSKVKMAALY